MDFPPAGRYRRAMRLVLLTALTMTAFAANSLLNRAALSGGGMDATAFGALRLASGALVLAGLALVMRRASPVRGMRALPVLALFTYIFGFSLAYTRLDAGLGALILFGTVQLTMFAGALRGREAIPALRWAGAALALVGLAWVFWPEGAVTVPLGAGVAMTLAGIGWGVYSLLGRGATDPLVETARAFLGATLLAGGVLVFDLGALGRVSGPGVALAVLSGAVTSGLGYALWYAILPALGASRAAVAQLTVPVIAIAGGALLLGEALTWPVAAAAALVLGGVALSLRAR